MRLFRLGATYWRREKTLSEDSRRVELLNHLEQARKSLRDAIGVCAAMAKEHSDTVPRIESMLRAIAFASALVRSAIGSFENGPTPQGRYDP